MAKIVRPDEVLRQAGPDDVRRARAAAMQAGPPIDPEALLQQNLGMSVQLLASIIRQPQWGMRGGTMKLLVAMHQLTGDAMGTALLSAMQAPGAGSVERPATPANEEQAPENKETTDRGQETKGRDDDGGAGERPAGGDGDAGKPGADDAG